MFSGKSFFFLTFFCVVSVYRDSCLKKKQTNPVHELLTWWGYSVVCSSTLLKISRGP